MEFSVYDYRPGAQKGDVLRLVISINNLLVQMAIRCTSPTPTRPSRTLHPWEILLGSCTIIES